MSSAITRDFLDAVSQHHDFYLSPVPTLKRKFARSPVIAHIGGLPRLLAYPSPPMSSPPSPPKTQPSELPFGFTTSTTGAGVGAIAPSTTLAPGTRSAHPGPQAPPLPYSASTTLSSAPITSISESFAGPPLIAGQQPSPYYAPSTAAAIPFTTSFAGSSTRTGRRSKTHVASACVNCKRAHLSCDVQRPCTRCVASGKQNSCIDVQHKKRGRPRLREEGEFQVLQTSADVSQGQAPAFTGFSQPPARPFAETRRRRAESFRSLASQTSEESYGFATSTPARSVAGTLQSPFAAQRLTTPTHNWGGFEVATALLNTDFAIIRANRPFEHIMFGGRDVRGRSIADLAAPADGESFQSIRNRLRAEREARDPAYMAPIMQPGHDPISRIPESEAEQYTASFNDQSYTWRQTQLGPVVESFPARIRLAKASTYFIVVTLPSFRPVEPTPFPAPGSMFTGPLLVGPPLQPPSSFGAGRYPTIHSAPPAVTFAVPGPTSAMQPPMGTSSFGHAMTYPPPHPPMPTQPHQPSILTPRLLVQEPPTEATGHTLRSVPTEPSRPIPTLELQLPPIEASPAALSGTIPPRRAEESSEEEEGDRRLISPKKRRRMGIDDVLQR